MPRIISKKANCGVLNRIVNVYLEFAELQALDRKPMTMRELDCQSWMSS